jgi:endonuclease I
MQRILLLILILLSIRSYAQIPDGYYDSAEGLSGNELKMALHSIIKNHTELTYDEVKYALRQTDKDTIDLNKVICFYTGWTYDADSFGNGNYNWNREHVWSKSHGNFGNDPPCGTDLHQLRPADASVNSAKSNRDFDWGVYEYLDKGVPTNCYQDDYIWEPRDKVKGDVARIIFYMATRYEGDDGEPNLEIVDYVNSAGDSYNPLYGKLITLLAWHKNDPVDTWEQNRNNMIYSQYQNNRNPFIDHPEYVDSIWSQTIFEEPTNHVKDFIVNAVEPTSITLSWNANDGDVAAHGFLLLINTSGSFDKPVDGTEYPNDTDLSDNKGKINLSHNTQSYQWQNLLPGTKYYFEIYPYSNSGDLIDYKTDGAVPAVQANTGNSTSNLIITEVADPSDSYKARFVEITNTGELSVDFDLETWYLCRQANGNENSWADIRLFGILKPDSSMTVSYNEADFVSAYGKSPDVTSGNISGNGNDGYFLYKNGDHESGVLIDTYGVINENGTGKEWQYLDSRAYRIYSVTKSSATWNRSEWIIENASTQNMTPDWDKRTLYWNGSVSNEFMNKENWNESNKSVAEYTPDASCKLIIRQTVFHPVINSSLKISIIEMDSNTTLEIINNAKLIIK